MIHPLLKRRAVLISGFAGLIAASLGRTSAQPTGTLDVRELGAVGDGVTDDTAALQKAHALGRPLFYPRTKNFYRVSAPLLVTNDVTGDKAAVRAVQDGNWRTTIFAVVLNERPLTISGMVLDGGYSGGEAGQLSQGIGLCGAHDVTVRDNVISNVYGDCVFVGTDKKRIASCRNVRIDGNTFVNPRRCAVAVTSVDNVAIVGNDIKQKGTFVAAVDVEPIPDGHAWVRNVTVKDNTFDTVAMFFGATKSDGVPVRGLSVVGNRGQAATFCSINSSSQASGVTIADNRFRSCDGRGPMLVLKSVNDVVIRHNVDSGPCGPGYRTLSLSDCRPTLEANSFCG